MYHHNASCEMGSLRMCPISSLTVLLQGGCGRISRSHGWTSLQLRDSGVLLGKTGWGALVLLRAWVVLWALWLHHNDCIFKGREALFDRVLHEVEGLLAIWGRWEVIEGDLVGTAHVILTSHIYMAAG